MPLTHESPQELDKLGPIRAHAVLVAFGGFGLSVPEPGRACDDRLPYPRLERLYLSR